MLTAPVVLNLLADPAVACGGFACDNQTPVLQAAERIVFGVDPGGEVEMHVQITFAGEAADFGWIVPVPADPDLFVTTSALFSQVAFATLPTFTLTRRVEGSCDEENGDSGSAGSFLDAAPNSDSTDASSVDEGGYDVTVVSQQTVGPYDTVVLRAASADDLLGWLEQAGYEIPATLDEVLQPYISTDASFVALKLAAGNDAGDLAPLGLRYRADKAAVPVRLTSISATPDMRMEVYLFGEGRGVPESYLHVGINDLAVDWWQAGANYPDVVTRAANEAGGHAFATDYFGPSSVVPAFFTGEIPEAGLRSAQDPFEWIDVLRRSALPATPELFEVLEDALGLPDGTGASVWACPGCNDTTTTTTRPFDPDAATDLVIERVYQPLVGAQALLDRFPRLARLTSSLDAVEMTVDPVFVTNHDLAESDVSNAWRAVMVYDCGNGKHALVDAPRRLELDHSGLVVRLPSESELAKLGMSEFEYIEALRENNAVVIEQLGAEGRGEVLVDHRPALAVRVAQFNELLAGCGGCSAGGGSGAGVALLGAAALVRRARRRP